MNPITLYTVDLVRCATCSYWPGEREIQLFQFKPMAVRAFAGAYPCMANRNLKVGAVNSCRGWRKWEKII